MPTVKYKKFYALLEEKNQKLFDQFQPIHDAFVAAQEAGGEGSAAGRVSATTGGSATGANHAKLEEQFHAIGRDVVDVAREWERRLCSGMERGNNAVYSQRLAEQFWGEVKKRFSHIQMVGLKKK